jgi:threonine dehydratase
MQYDLPLAMVHEARQRITPYVRRTPLLPAPLIHTDVPPHLCLKLENMQVCGSFKPRGVFNNLLQLGAPQRKRGVVASSGGNHGLALAYGACRLGIRAVIYLPANAGADREARIAAWGAEVIRHGEIWDDAHARALEHADAEGLTYIHPFDAERTVAGQGTLGLELLDALPDLDCALVAIGGGGLISGVAATIKQRRPAARIVGVEPVGAASMTHSLHAGAVQPLDTVQTIAETLAPRSVSERTLALARRYVDEVVLVEDARMVEAMRWLWVECNQLVEPAGAAVIAALLTGAVDVSQAARPVAVICGGNAAAASVFATYQQE